jgi:hypothetical protein
MPLFEVDASRPLLVQAGRSGGAVEPSLGTTAHRVVDSHIDGLLGEQIFPVAQGAGPDEPHLLALDATGSPVVVELVGELDRGALTKALDHAGWAGRLTRGEIAARYHGGNAAFQRDVAAFYDSVPITRSQPGRSSARLIVICQEAGDEILNAVDFLRQPTMPVEVLKMGVMHTQDGRRFVDVSPLVIHPSSEATAPQLSGVAPVAPASAEKDADDGTFAEGVKVGRALHGRSPAVVAPPAGSGPGTAAQPVVTRPGFARPAAGNAPDPAGATQAPRAAEPSWSGGTRRTGHDQVGDTSEQPSLRRSRADRRAASGVAPLATSSDAPARPPASGSVPHPPAPEAAPVPAPVPAPAASRHAPVPPPPAPVPVPAPQDAPTRPAEPPRRRARADRFRSAEPARATPELAAFTASASSAQDLDLAELARRTTSPASADTPGFGEDFARVAASSFTVPERRSARQDPAPRESSRQDSSPRESSRRDPLPRDPAPRERAPWDPPQVHGVDPLDTRVPLSAMGSGGWEPSTPDRWTSGSDDLPRLTVPPLEAPSYTPPPERGLYDSVPASDDEVDGDLIALASMLIERARLVWSRPRRREQFEAWLLPEGFIELPDGSRYQHPDRAAAAASGAPTDDGWNVWRIEPDGISLLEAYRARFA